MSFQITFSPIITVLGGPQLLSEKRPAVAGTWPVKSYDGSTMPIPKAEVVIAEGEDVDVVGRLLDNEYELQWEGMLWGWGKLLYEELPLVVEV